MVANVSLMLYGLIYVNRTFQKAIKSRYIANSGGLSQKLIYFIYTISPAINDNFERVSY